MALVHLLLLGLFCHGILGLNCSDCIDSGKIWCMETSECSHQNGNISCQVSINVTLNCPTTPKFKYDDEFVRTDTMVLISAVHNENPQICFDNQIPTMKLYKRRSVNCSKKYDNVTCQGYTAYDTERKVIAISYRGGNGDNQGKDMTDSLKEYGLENYFNFTDGKVLKFTHDYFMSLLEGGMKQDLEYLKNKYPDYEVWVTGHSLGSSLAWLSATWIVESKLFKPEQMKVIVMGAPRFCDYNFAKWLTETFPYNFHILHKNDLVAHLPRYVAVTNTTTFYPKTEIWYNNNMKRGDVYQICQHADGNFCSGTSNISDPVDHLYYFNIHFPNWGSAGCPNNVTGFEEP